MSENSEREARILAAAAELFLRFGFDKTTVSEIAQQAGISKGAVYLHFKSKEQVLERLIWRETLRYSETWLELIEADPQGGSLAGIYKNVLYALQRTPVMAALFKQDRQVLGQFLRKPDNFLRLQQNRSVRTDFVGLMQEAGALRADLEPRIVAHIMNMLAYGLVAMDQIMDPDEIPPTAEIIEGIAWILDQALTPQGGGNPEAAKAIIRNLTLAAREQLATALDPSGGSDDLR